MSSQDPITNGQHSTGPNRQHSELVPNGTTDAPTPSVPALKSTPYRVALVTLFVSFLAFAGALLLPSVRGSTVLLLAIAAGFIAVADAAIEMAKDAREDLAQNLDYWKLGYRVAAAVIALIGVIDA